MAMSSGCMSTRVAQRLASGQVGCHPDKVQVVEKTLELGIHDWTVKCSGKTYYCTLASYQTAYCSPAR
jgi:hypothetical protein